MPELSEIEKQIVAAIQGDIPITQRPYADIAERLGISEEELIEKLNALNDRGIIRRFGATLRHQKSGFSANAMAAWQVDEDRVEAVGKQMALFKQVSHCYRRNPTPQWPYNLYTMIHATDMASCKAVVQKMAEKTSVSEFTLLFSRKELKKTSMEYFSEETDN